MLTGRTLAVALLLLTVSVGCATRTVFRLPPTTVYEERMYGMLLFDGEYMVMNIESLEADEETWPLLMLDDITGDICIENFLVSTIPQQRREICKTMEDVKKFIATGGDVRYRSPPAKP